MKEKQKPVLPLFLLRTFKKQSKSQIVTVLHYLGKMSIVIMCYEFIVPKG